MRNKILVVSFIVLVTLSLYFTVEDIRAEVVEVEGDKAKLTLVEGSAKVLREKDRVSQVLRKGDVLEQGDRVTTGKKSRIELALSDGSFLRFDEQTTFELISVDYDEESKQRDVDVRMTLGKTWAKVASLAGGRGNFRLSTDNAIAGVRGTTYRMNVNADKSVVVKVYWGEIHVSSPQKEEETPARLSKPTIVEGPHPIEGPRPVTMEEWTYIVRAMQQIVVLPDGTVSKPFRFDPSADADDWVRWNQTRDNIR